jgi:hypothetical protein
MEAATSCADSSILRRVPIGFVVVLAGVFLALLPFGKFSNLFAQPSVATQAQGQQTQEEHLCQSTVIPAYHSDLFRPLREQQWSGRRARKTR